MGCEQSTVAQPRKARHSERHRNRPVRQQRNPFAAGGPDPGSLTTNSFSEMSENSELPQDHDDDSSSLAFSPAYTPSTSLNSSMSSTNQEERAMSPPREAVSSRARIAKMAAASRKDSTSQRTMKISTSTESAEGGLPSNATDKGANAVSILGARCNIRWTTMDGISDLGHAASKGKKRTSLTTALLDREVNENDMSLHSVDDSSRSNSNSNSTTSNQLLLPQMNAGEQPPSATSDGRVDDEEDGEPFAPTQQTITAIPEEAALPEVQLIPLHQHHQSAPAGSNAESFGNTGMSNGITTILSSPTTNQEKSPAAGGRRIGTFPLKPSSTPLSMDTSREDHPVAMNRRTGAPAPPELRIERHRQSPPPVSARILSPRPVHQRGTSGSISELQEGLERLTSRDPSPTSLGNRYTRRATPPPQRPPPLHRLPSF